MMTWHMVGLSTSKGVVSNFSKPVGFPYCTVQPSSSLKSSTYSSNHKLHCSLAGFVYQNAQRIFTFDARSWKSTKYEHRRHNVIKDEHQRFCNVSWIHNSQTTSCKWLCRRWITWINVHIESTSWIHERVVFDSVSISSTFPVEFVNFHALADLRKFV